MSQSQPIEVLIVGAGPTGLTLAYQLRRLGISFRLIEKNAVPSTTSKAIGLQYRVSEVLTWMGLFERFRARSVIGTDLRFYAGGKPILTVQLDGLSGVNGQGAFTPQSIVIPQSVTEELLGAGLREQGGEVEWNTAFVTFSQDRERVISRIKHADGSEETVTSRYLVSCEGAHSLIRKQAGFTFEGKTYPLALFMGDVEIDWPTSRTAIHVWMHEQGMFSAIPMPGERRWRLFAEVGTQAKADNPAVTLDLIRRLMAERTGDHSSQVSNPTWLSEFRISCRMVDRFSNGRVFLVGDAAHIHSPTGGQGITTGMQDAYNLAWKLGMVLRQGAPDALLETYNEERLPIVREVLKRTDQNTNVFLAHSRAGQLFRDHVFLPLLRTRTVSQRLIMRLSQLGVNYRGRSLSAHQEAGLLGHVRVRAGDRTPDVTFRDARTGAQTSLFEQLSHAKPIALIGQEASLDHHARLHQALGRLDIASFTVQPAGMQPVSDGDCLIDVAGDFQRLYGARGAFLYLIRPDGYVGLFQRPIDERGLRAYLARFCEAEAVNEAFTVARSGLVMQKRVV